MDLTWIHPTDFTHQVRGTHSLPRALCKVECARAWTWTLSTLFGLKHTLNTLTLSQTHTHSPDFLCSPEQRRQQQQFPTEGDPAAASGPLRSTSTGTRSIPTSAQLSGHLLAAVPGSAPCHWAPAADRCGASHGFYASPSWCRRPRLKVRQYFCRAMRSCV